MKKQVTFAESPMVHRLHQDDALPRCSRMNESKMEFVAAGVNVKKGPNINRQPAARCEPRLQQATIPLPKTMTTAPFLTHTALTPAQKEYLYTVAASYSTTHVRNLITQHYMNVLHRCSQAASPENDESEKHPSAVPSRAQHKGKLNAGTRNPGKSSLTKIPKRQARLSNNSGARRGRGGGGDESLSIRE